MWIHEFDAISTHVVTALRAFAEPPYGEKTTGSMAVHQVWSARLLPNFILKTCRIADLKTQEVPAHRRTVGMERRMEPVEVWTRDGAIFLAQDKSGDRNGVVKLTSDQVPLLVEWLQSARSELSNGQLPQQP